MPERHKNLPRHFVVADDGSVLAQDVVDGVARSFSAEAIRVCPEFNSKMRKQGRFDRKKDILPADYRLLANIWMDDPDSAYGLAIIEKDGSVSTPRPSIPSHLLLPPSRSNLPAAITTATMQKGPEDERLEMALYIARQSMAREDRISKAKKQRLTERTAKRIDEQHSAQARLLRKKAKRNRRRHGRERSRTRSPSPGPSGRGRSPSEVEEIGEAGEAVALPVAEDVEMAVGDVPAGNGGHVNAFN
ncbi:hypothetical protein C8Q80DRAFT_1116835 [Daedaleopsis nitida]|nr:hypothetical protein C8Q80DRAFT_1116835 [Daedaleopsis nitida]